jgi:hypothetical protein
MTDTSDSYRNNQDNNADDAEFAELSSFDEANNGQLSQGQKTCGCHGSLAEVQELFHSPKP